MNAPRSFRSTPTREQFAALDAADPLAPLRQLFELPPEVIYLDGNSLGALPKATPDRVQRTMRDEWGRGLITSWNHAGWIDLPGRRRQDPFSPGRRRAELVVADSTSVNLFGVVGALLLRRRHSATRRVIVSERSDFPTDHNIAQSIAAAHTARARSAEQLGSALDEVAVLISRTSTTAPAVHDLAAHRRRRACVR